MVPVMARMSSFPAGTPSYVDIGSPDPAATAAFYSALFGWSVDDLGPDAGGYRMARIEGDDVAGIGPQQSPGPPYWTTYFTVDDVDLTAKKVESAGGSVLAPPMDIPGGGRIAVFMDVNGAAFSVWRAGDASSNRVNENGTLCWNELNTRNLDAAKNFYADVFGWTYGGGDDYPEFEVDGRSVGGMAVMTEDRFPPEVPEHWLVYFAVDDVQSAYNKIAELGGTTMMEPFEAGGVGTMTVAMDPHGAAFAVIQLNEPAA
jgi:predicted enzyme related to lactoylglutathione lyase